MAELQKDLVLSPNEYAYVLDETKVMLPVMQALIR